MIELFGQQCAFVSYYSHLDFSHFCKFYNALEIQKSCCVVSRKDKAVVSKSLVDHNIKVVLYVTIDP